MEARKVLSAPVPYIALFGVDGMGKGRPTADSPAGQMAVRLEVPDPNAVGGQLNAYRMRNEARGRALAVLKTVYARDFLRIYRKELDHLVEVARKEAG